jgi:hypothetical protein
VQIGIWSHLESSALIDLITALPDVGTSAATIQPSTITVSLIDDQLDRIASKHTIRDVNSPLHEAVIACREDVVASLVGKYDVNAAIKGGNTPLLEAARVRCENVSLVLIAAGANVNLNNDYGLTALHWAAKYGDSDIVKRLINVTAKVNAIDHNHTPPLHYACHTPHQDVIDVLLQEGAIVNATNANNQTASDWARYYGHEDLSVWLSNQTSVYKPEPEPVEAAVATPAEATTAPAAVAITTESSSDTSYDPQSNGVLATTDTSIVTMAAAALIAVILA